MGRNMYWDGGYGREDIEGPRDVHPDNEYRAKLRFMNDLESSGIDVDDGDIKYRPRERSWWGDDE